MNVCPRCSERYDERSNDAALCVVCMAELAGSLDHQPFHKVTEEGIDAFGRRYVRVRYADGSDDFVGTLWDEEGGAPGGG